MSATIENYCIDCKAVAQPDCDERGHVVGTLGHTALKSNSEFDEVFEQLEAPEYPAACDECGVEEHVCQPRNESPVPRAGEGDQSGLFSRYTFAVVTGRYKILDNRSDGPVRITQIATADGEEEARLIIHALNQHSTLLAQRDRLLEALKSTAHNAADGSGLCWCSADDRVFGHHRKCTTIRRVLNEVNAAIATIEQEGKS